MRYSSPSFLHNPGLKIKKYLWFGPGTRHFIIENPYRLGLYKNPGSKYLMLGPLKPFFTYAYKGLVNLQEMVPQPFCSLTIQVRLIFKTSHGRHTIHKSLLFENTFRSESKNYLKLITKIFHDSGQDVWKVKH